MSNECDPSSPKRSFNTFFRPGSGDDEQDHGSGKIRIKSLKKRTAILFDPIQAAKRKQQEEKEEEEEKKRERERQAETKSSSSSAAGEQNKKLHPFFAKHRKPTQTVAGQQQPVSKPSSFTTSKPKEPSWPDKLLFQGGHVPQPPINDNRQQQQQRASWVTNIGKVNHDRLSNIVSDESARFFACLKKARQKEQERSIRVASKPTTSQDIRQLSVPDEIEHFIYTIYPCSKTSAACQAILQRIKKDNRQENNENDNNDDQKIPWTEKYRPHRVSELLSNGNDSQLYLRDWLHQMKIAPPTEIKVKQRKLKSIEREIALEQSDQDFMPSQQKRHQKKKNDNAAAALSSSVNKMESNLILIAGNSGSGKTAAVYTAAEEAGYHVFEIHPGMRRSGKDLVAYVGEMTESHLVDGSNPRKRKRDIHDDHEGDRQQRQQQQKQQKKEQEDSQHNIQQSLVLLEEVDLLYEEDKGFWSAVVELAQKSKRPIVLTCNDLELVPVELLFLQAILWIEAPLAEELMAYLQLICLAQGILVHPADLAGLYALIGHDVRQLITTLQVWCSSSTVSRQQEQRSFHEIRPGMLSSFVQDLQGSLLLLDKSRRRTDIDLAQFFETYSSIITTPESCSNVHAAPDEDDDLAAVVQIFDTASFQDAWLDRSRRLHPQTLHSDHNDMDIQEQQDQIVTCKSLGQDVEEQLMLQSQLSLAVSAENDQRTASAELKSTLAESVWDALSNSREIAATECLAASQSILPLRRWLSKQQTMTDYVPYIRSMCLHDQGVVNRGRTLRSRRRRRYLLCTDEEREALLAERGVNNPTMGWCQQTLTWSERYLSTVKGLVLNHHLHNHHS